MKKRSSLAIFLWVILLSLALMSVTASSTIQTNVLLARANAAPSKPTVKIIYPTQDDILEFGTHTINVLASDPTEITLVKLKIDGPESTKGWVDITASQIGDNYSFDWTVGTEGDYSITARATNGAGRQAADTLGVTVTATPPAPDFTLDASPSTLLIVVGSSDTSTITVTSLNGFSDPVDLMVSGQPANVIATLTPAQVTPPADGSATSTLTVTVDSSATPGPYTLTITGTSGLFIHSIDVGLEITAPPSVYTLTVQVQDEGGFAIEGATVTVDGLSGTTDNLGNAVFPDLEEDTYTVTASKTGYTSTSDTVILDDDKTVTLTLTTAPAFEYELFIEIDYMPGHKPTPSVLDYIHGYYSDHGIGVTFYVDDQVPSDQSVSDADFWAIETAYNDLGDDKYTGELANFQTKWKWVLFGTRVSGAYNVVGYTYVIVEGGDLLAGNYIFIADTTADRWAARNGIEAYGAEAVVLMHEMGHSIGIAKLDPNGREIYDPDPYSVMSYLSTANAGLYWAWYYSDDYWATRNMEYYAI